MMQVPLSSMHQLANDAGATRRIRWIVILVNRYTTMTVTIHCEQNDTATVALITFWKLPPNLRNINSRKNVAPITT
jgi:hypothetical protein